MSKILPYNPLAKISETYSWKTAVNSCWSGEERISLRDNPSLAITYTYVIKSDFDLMAFHDFVSSRLGNLIKIPMWSSPYFNAGLVLANNFEINLTNSFLHYIISPGDEVIIWKSIDSFSTYIVDAISRRGVRFTTPIGTNYSAFYILPLLTGKFNKAVNFTKGSGGRKRTSLVFEVSNFVFPDTFRESALEPALGKVLQSSEFSTFTKQDKEIISSPLGVSETIATSDIRREAWKASFSFSSKAELFNLFALIQGIKGRARPLPFNYSYLGSGYSWIYLVSDSVTIEHSFRNRTSVTLELEAHI